VLYPAWILARNPAEILLFSSYSSILANRDSVKCRSLVESDWYQRRFPHVVIKDDQNLKSAWITTAKGGRQTTSVGGTVTGMGGHFLITDDPIAVDKAESVVERENANVWFKETWSNRIEGDPEQAVSIVIMQRVHSNDVASLCVEEMGYEKLVLPMEYEGDKHVTSIGWSDPRTTQGELMWPQMWSAKAVATQKKKSGEYAWATQYQQRPAPRGGGIIKKRWLRFWYDPERCHNPKPVTAVDEKGEHHELEQVVFIPNDKTQTQMSVDAAFKGESTSDYTVCQIWTKQNANFMLLDQVRERMDFVATVKTIRDLHEKWKPLPSLIEDKANGSAIISTLKNELDGIIPVNPEGGKFSRLSATAPLIEAGNIYLPHPDMCPWVNALIEELILFPAAPNDDQVDALSMAMTYMRERRVDLVDVSTNFATNEDVSGVSLTQDCYWEGAS